MRDGRLGEVPPHLRDSHYAGAAKIGHGNDYVYPHDDPRGWVPQRHLPVELSDRRYYEPGEHGFEAEIARRQAHLTGQEASDDGDGPSAPGDDAAPD